MPTCSRCYYFEVGKGNYGWCYCAGEPTHQDLTCDFHATRINPETGQQPPPLKPAPLRARYREVE